MCAVLATCFARLHLHTNDDANGMKKKDWTKITRCNSNPVHRSRLPLVSRPSHKWGRFLHVIWFDNKILSYWKSLNYFLQIPFFPHVLYCILIGYLSNVPHVWFLSVIIVCYALNVPCYSVCNLHILCCFYRNGGFQNWYHGHLPRHDPEVSDGKCWRCCEVTHPIDTLHVNATPFIIEAIC